MPVNYYYYLAIQFQLQFQFWRWQHICLTVLKSTFIFKEFCSEACASVKKNDSDSPVEIGAVLKVNQYTVFVRTSLVKEWETILKLAD